MAKGGGGSGRTRRGTVSASRAGLNYLISKATEGSGRDSPLRREVDRLYWRQRQMLRTQVLRRLAKNRAAQDRILRTRGDRPFTDEERSRMNRLADYHNRAQIVLHVLGD